MVVLYVCITGGTWLWGKPDCMWCDGSEGISRKSSRALSIEETLRGFWGWGGMVKGGESVVTTISDVVLVLRLNENVRTNK